MGGGGWGGGWVGAWTDTDQMFNDILSDIQFEANPRDMRLCLKKNYRSEMT